VRVVETGHERAAGEIDPAGGRTGLSQDGVCVADNGNSTLAHADGGRNRRHRLREDVTVVQDEIEHEINFQLSTFNSQLSTLNFQLSTFNSQLSTLNAQR
jgi:hypothetical protein